MVMIVQPLWITNCPAAAAIINMIITIIIRTIIIIITIMTIT